VLTGGRRKRRVGRGMVVFALLAVAAAAGATMYFGVVRHSRGSSGGGNPPLASASAPVRAQSHSSSLLSRAHAPAIRMSEGDLFQAHFSKPPHAALVFDVDNGRVLARYKPYKRLPIASLTKIMTALLVTEAAGPDERVMITRDPLHYGGTGIGILPRGKRVRLETLLNGLLIVSGNDAAIALADHVSGSRRRFVDQMNRRARMLGLHCTHYVSPHGLERQNRSCPHDLAVLARLAMRDRRITRIVRRRGISLPFPVKGGRLVIFGHNPLIRDVKYPGAIGLKTGFIDASGPCFVGIARRHGHTLGVVLLNSPNPGKQAAGLLNAGFRRLRSAG
jgi:D-alanyl-D-alanine carboxypeptidase (penicillin-binding protein 5/6)